MIAIPKKIVIIGMMLGVAVISCLLTSLLTGNSAKAIPDDVACKNVTTQNYTNDCVDNVYKNIPENLRTGITQDQMVEMAKSCMNHDSNGLGKHEGGCVNAAASCIAHVYEPTKNCKDALLTEMVDDCNDGKLQNQRDQGCDIIWETNDNYLRAIHDKAVEEARTTCTVPADGTGQNSARSQCAAAVCSSYYDANGCAGQGACTVEDGLKKDTTWTPYEIGRDQVEKAINDYQECMNKALISSAKNQDECKSRGGIYVDKEYKDPTGGNSDVAAGCKALDSDLINKDACAAGAASSGKKLVWMQTGGKDTKTTADDAWGCEEDADGDGKADADKNDPNAECPKDLNGNCATITGTDQHCGDARVNLLGCGESTKGAAAFNAILKIIIIVLTVLIGIAAVGGLAYAALTYARAEDNSGTISEAKTLIRNIVIGIVLYGFLIAIVTWLVPGLSLT